MVTLHIVNDLDNGPISIYFIQNDGVRSLYHREPLPGSVLLRRESAEQRVRRVHHQAQGARGDRFSHTLADVPEHTVVPVIGLKQSAHRMGSVGRHQQDGSAVLEGLQGGRIQCLFNEDAALVGGVIGRIDPDGPVVLPDAVFRMGLHH